MLANRPRSTLRAVTLAATGALALAACSSVPGGAPLAGGPAPEGQPGIAFSGAQPTAQNQAVIDALMELGLRPYHTLTPQDARQQPTFADGVKRVLEKQGRPTTPPPGVTTRDIQIPGPAGAIPARVYTRTGATGPCPSSSTFTAAAG